MTVVDFAAVERKGDVTRTLVVAVVWDVDGVSALVVKVLVTLLLNVDMVVEVLFVDVLTADRTLVVVAVVVEETAPTAPNADGDEDPESLFFDRTTYVVSG